MSDYPKVSQGVMGEEDTAKTNTELFLDIVGQYFPEAIKDGEVDFDALKEEMGEFREIGSEHYDFTWAGKQAAKKEAQSDLFGRTLRFKPQDSVNADTTENIYIEGDNLEALKLLRRNYQGQIKMIYIDPPYNTGKDFIYHDNFTMTEEELSELSGDTVDGERLQKNTKDGAKYHTNWLNMMYPRLKLARELLSDTGVIFISIDDNEQGNLKKLCDEIFGANNIDVLIWQKTDPWVDRNTNAKQVTRFLEFKEYIIVCYMDKLKTIFNKISRLPDWKHTQKNPDNDPRGNWQSGIFSYEEGHKNEDTTSDSYFEIETPGGKKYTRMWFCENKVEYESLCRNGLLYFGKDGNSAPRKKYSKTLKVSII